MNKYIKILFLLVTISLLCKTSVKACGPYFPEYNYDPDQILNEYYPLINNLGSTNPDTNPILNNKFEVITPLLGPEYLFPIYLASVNKQLPSNIKEAWVKYLDNRDYYVNLKRKESTEDRSSVDSPVLNTEVYKPSIWQKFMAIFDGIINNNSSPEKMNSEYKLAADEYHKGNYDQSIQLFTKIYKNKKQINRDKAALSLGWSYIAKANQQYEKDLKAESKDAEKNQIANLKIAQSYYEKIIADSSLSEVKFEAEKYLDYVLYRTDPIARLTRAGNSMLTATDPKEFLRNLNDYIPLWYKYFYGHIAYNEDTIKFEEYSKKIKASGDEFSQFLLAWTDTKSNSIDENIGKYKSTNSPLWLILAQRQATTDNQQWAYVDSEIKKLAPTSTFYLSAQYFNLKAQSADSKLKDSIKKTIIDLISKTKEDKYYGAENLFTGLMFNISDGLMEKQKYSLVNYLGYADKYWGERLLPPFYSYGGYASDNPRLILKEMKEILSSTSIDDQNKLLTNENIFNSLTKQYLRLILFVRATVENRMDISKNIAVLLAKNNSEISKDIIPFIRSQDTEEQKFLAAKFVLGYPGITDISNSNFDEF
ncbi:MAG: hypothetical protein NTY75_04640, partial [Candidatus Shapirobacteria bacterium]|nr:hypothetical protein [Candidatus Shapirobacteria bacterium]